MSHINNNVITPLTITYVPLESNYYYADKSILIGLVLNRGRGVEQTYISYSFFISLSLSPLFVIFLPHGTKNNCRRSYRYVGGTRDGKRRAFIRDVYIYTYAVGGKPIVSDDGVYNYSCFFTNDM